MAEFIEPSMTGIWVSDRGPGFKNQWEVRFAFEGETLFENESDAIESARQYRRIIAEKFVSDLAEVEVLQANRIAELEREVERLDHD